MNTQTFQSRLKRTVLATGKCFLIAIVAVAAVTAQSAQEADVSVNFFSPRLSPFVKGETLFQVIVSVSRSSPAVATGVVIEIEIPDGAVPTFVGETAELCDFVDGFIICKLEEIRTSIDGKTLPFKVQAADGARTLSVTAKVKANEFDPNTDNNTATSTALLGKTRNKGIRVF